MGLLRYVTFTGVDERTDFNELQRMSNACHFVEWGVLYDPSRAGKGGRYPSLAWLDDFARRANAANLTIALHLCGQAVKTLLQAASAGRPFSPEAQQLFDLAEKFGRVQLNTRGKVSDEPAFRKLIGFLSRNENRTRVMLQWNAANEELCERLAMEHAFEVLVDSSGGRGLEPDEWPSLEPRGLRRVGYAGGLGPDNIAEQLPRIAASVDGRAFWVDMEFKLRNDEDDFLLSKCERVLDVAWDYQEEQDRLQGALWGVGMRDVATLEGLWLDWWVATARNKDVVVPPLDACKAVTLYRPTGSFESWEPSSDVALATRILSDERIALSPREDGSWQGQAVASGAAPVAAKDLHIAGLRAVVAKHFGLQVPLNPSELQSN